MRVRHRRTPRDRNRGFHVGSAEVPGTIALRTCAPRSGRRFRQNASETSGFDLSLSDEGGWLPGGNNLKGRTKKSSNWLNSRLQALELLLPFFLSQHRLDTRHMIKQHRQEIALGDLGAGRFHVFEHITHEAAVPQGHALGSPRGARRVHHNRHIFVLSFTLDLIGR